MKILSSGKIFEPGELVHIRGTIADVHCKASYSTPAFGCGRGVLGLVLSCIQLDECVDKDIVFTKTWAYVLFSKVFKMGWVATRDLQDLK